MPLNGCNIFRCLVTAASPGLARDGAGARAMDAGQTRWAATRLRTPPSSPQPREPAEGSPVFTPDRHPAVDEHRGVWPAADGSEAAKAAAASTPPRTLEALLASDREGQAKL